MESLAVDEDEAIEALERQQPEVSPPMWRDRASLCGVSTALDVVSEVRLEGVVVVKTS